MTCLNGGKCKVGVKNLPYCECQDKRFAGTQCEIGYLLLLLLNEIIKLINSIKLKIIRCYKWSR